MTRGKAPGQGGAAEARRLARISELARENRRSGRLLERAIRAGHERGISIRRLADAAGLGHMQVWRLARPANGHTSAASTAEHAAKPAAKPERRRK